MNASTFTDRVVASKGADATALQRLNVAHDPVGNVQVGVQPQLIETPTDAGDTVEHVLAQHLKRRLDLAGGIVIV